MDSFEPLHRGFTDACTCKYMYIRDCEIWDVSLGHSLSHVPNPSNQRRDISLYLCQWPSLNIFLHTHMRHKHHIMFDKSNAIYDRLDLQHIHSTNWGQRAFGSLAGRDPVTWYWTEGVIADRYLEAKMRQTITNRYICLFLMLCVSEFRLFCAFFSFEPCMHNMTLWVVH